MDAVQRLKAAIEKLETQRSRSTVGPWTSADMGVYGWGGLLDAVVESGSVLTRDAELIVTLHRTIDAQLAILRAAQERYWGSVGGGAGRLFANDLALADAILGIESGDRNS